MRANVVRRERPIREVFLTRILAPGGKRPAKPDLGTSETTVEPPAPTRALATALSALRSRYLI
jgi:hypothetical protein